MPAAVHQIEVLLVRLGRPSVDTAPRQPAKVHVGGRAGEERQEPIGPRAPGSLSQEHVERADDHDLEDTARPRLVLLEAPEQNPSDRKDGQDDGEVEPGGPPIPAHVAGPEPTHGRPPEPRKQTDDEELRGGKRRGRRDR